MRFRGTVTPLYEGHRQPAKARPEYSFAASVEQAGRFLRVRYPYPKYLVENVVPDPEEEAAKPNSELAQQLSMNIAKEADSHEGDQIYWDGAHVHRPWARANR